MTQGKNRKEDTEDDRFKTEERKIKVWRACVGAFVNQVKSGLKFGFLLIYMYVYTLKRVKVSGVGRGEPGSMVL